MADGSGWFSRIIRIAGLFGLCLFSGLVGGVLTRHVGPREHTISYADFISILLTAISLLMTVLAIFLAVAGFVGWTTIEQKVQGKTDDFLAAGFGKGGRFDRIIIETIERRTEEIMFEGVQSLGDEMSAQGQTNRSGEEKQQ